MTMKRPRSSSPSTISSAMTAAAYATIVATTCFITVAVAAFSPSPCPCSCSSSTLLSLSTPFALRSIFAVPPRARAAVSHTRTFTLPRTISASALSSPHIQQCQISLASSSVAKEETFESEKYAAANAASTVTTSSVDNGDLDSTNEILGKNGILDVAKSALGLSPRQPRLLQATSQARAKDDGLSPSQSLHSPSLSPRDELSPSLPAATLPSSSSQDRAVFSPATSLLPSWRPIQDAG